MNNGISPKMLTQNLRMLERNGLLERKVRPPSCHRGSSTPSPGRAKALRATVDGMCARTHQYLGHIEASRMTVPATRPEPACRTAPGPPRE